MYAIYVHMKFDFKNHKALATYIISVAYSFDVIYVASSETDKHASAILSLKLTSHVPQFNPKISGHHCVAVSLLEGPGVAVHLSGPVVPTPLPILLPRLAIFCRGHRLVHKLQHNLQQTLITIKTDNET